jgi:enoyl-CoA hydratase
MDKIGFYKLEASDGIGRITFSRPPVNAMGRETYDELAVLSREIESRNDIRVVVLQAGPDAKAWCAGADLKQLSIASNEDRAGRYDVINPALAAFYSLTKPVIGALNGPCIGMGMVLASLCDIRVGAEDAFFSLPEVERGMAAPIGVFLTRVGMPSSFVRELLFTGSKYLARDFMWTGFFSHVLPRDQVPEKALSIAASIARHRPAAIAASKTIANQSEFVDWVKQYKAGQEFSVSLAKSPDARREIHEFLASRKKEA